MKIIIVEIMAITMAIITAEIMIIITMEEIVAILQMKEKIQQK